MSGHVEAYPRWPRGSLIPSATLVQLFDRHGILATAHLSERKFVMLIAMIRVCHRSGLLQICPSLATGEHGISRITYMVFESLIFSPHWLDVANVAVHRHSRMLVASNKRLLSRPIHLLRYNLYKPARRPERGHQRVYRMHDIFRHFHHSGPMMF